jgi:hypothetical protein
MKRNLAPTVIKTGPVLSQKMMAQCPFCIENVALSNLRQQTFPCRISNRKAGLLRRQAHAPEHILISGIGAEGRETGIYF